MSQAKIDILQRALEREKAARKSAEEILDEKSRHLYFLSEKLKKTNKPSLNTRVFIAYHLNGIRLIDNF